MMRTLVLGIALLAAAAPLSAQGHQHDPDRPAAGGGHALPDGWHARPDRAGANMAGLRFAPMAPGWHVTTGPAVILWRPQDTATGEFTASATIHQTKAPAHPEAYGIFVAGSGLDTAPDYLYFLVRGDGKYMVRHRATNGDVHTVVDWTESPAVRKQDAAGAASNALVVEGGPWGVRFKVNGTQVGEFPGVKSSGNVGLRVNHNLDVHVAEFAVTRR
jgi:hypothetical protein